MLGKIIDQQLRDPTTEAYLISWEGNKVPSGINLGGRVIAHTQHGMVNDSHHQQIGYYSRLVEFGGSNGKSQMMLVVVDQARLDWGDLIKDLLDRTVGNFRRTQSDLDLAPGPEKKNIVKVMVGGTDAGAWQVPNQSVQRALMRYLADRLPTSPESKSDRIKLNHPEYPNIDATIFGFSY